jgi:hypothetical protein
LPCGPERRTAVWPRQSVQTGSRMQGLMQHTSTVSARAKSLLAFVEVDTADIQGFLQLNFESKILSIVYKIQVSKKVK